MASYTGPYTSMGDIFRLCLAKTGGVTAATHTQDSDCTVDPETGMCTVCRVDHTTACHVCGGRGFHKAGCRAADPEPEPVAADAEVR
jgi:hypothetical protein